MAIKKYIIQKIAFFDLSSYSPWCHIVSFFLPNPLHLCYSLKSDKLWKHWDKLFVYIWLLKETMLCQRWRKRSEIAILTIANTYCYTTTNMC